MVEPAVKPGAVVKCPECGTSFLCGVQSEDCWCWEVPAKAVREAIGAECLCRDCLTR
ncbi:MAG: cysteine-rich CWC family protein [Thermoplasmata archaeon]